MAPFGQSQLKFFGGEDDGEESVLQYDDGDYSTYLPIGYESWGMAWRAACRIVRQEGIHIPPPPNPREWLHVQAADECPKCGDEKTPGFIRCRACAADRY